MDFSKDALLRELSFKTSRSGGKDGQHINKVSSKVEINLNIPSSTLFSDEQKALLFKNIPNKINSAGILQVITQEERSQLLNKERGIDKLLVLLRSALYRAQPRKTTRPGKLVNKKRMMQKRAIAMKKISRKKILGLIEAGVLFGT